jgi:uncharacterized iron-regulated membrane protein
MNKKHIQNSRRFRVYHRKIGLVFLSFFILMSITGFLLALKDVLHLKPQIAVSQTQSVGQWITLAEIDSISKQYVRESLKQDTTIDRIDIRPSKNVAKVLFVNHFTELQINLATGEIISVNSRVDTIIEKIHDGSIIDYFLTQSNISKIAYSSLVSLGFIFMSISGLFLWYLPKKIKYNKLKK